MQCKQTLEKCTSGLTSFGNLMLTSFGNLMLLEAARLASMLASDQGSHRTEGHSRP